MNVASFLVLSLICLVSLFFYSKKHALFQLIPFGLVAGIIILLASQGQNHTVDHFTAGWASLPGIMINVVFATLFFGKKLIGVRNIWRFAGPQIVFGQTLAWGQYVVGVILTALVLVPVYNMSPLSAALIEISFEGGHGTAAGLGELFHELNFSEGADLALGLATVGIVVGLLSGLCMVAISKRSSLFMVKKRAKTARKPWYSLFGTFIIETHNQYLARHVFLRTLLQLGLIGLAIAVGYVIKQAMLQAENITQVFVSYPDIVSYIPLFPLAMIGGIIVQTVMNKFGLGKLIHGKTVAFVGAIALEVVIITAIATMSLAAISSNLEPFILLAVVGTIWNVTVFLLLAPRIMSSYWFQRGIGDYGQSMGMTATGLLLMKSADPANKSQALERFGYKQLLFEPIVGGGIFTAMSMIIISQFGLWVMFWLTLAITLFWVILGLRCFAKH